MISSVFCLNTKIFDDSLDRNVSTYKNMKNSLEYSTYYLGNSMGQSKTVHTKIISLQTCITISSINTLCVYVFSCSVVSDSLQHFGLQPARLLCPWDFSSQNTGVGCHFLLQGIFLTQGSNLHRLCLPALASGFFTTSAKLSKPLFFPLLKWGQEYFVHPPHNYCENQT